MKPAPLQLYRAATGLLEPMAPGLLRARVRRGKEEAGRLNERLGRPGLSRPAGPLVWLHGVSVGESLSLLPVVEGLRARRPELTVLVTSGTTTAADLLSRRLPDGVLHQYAPLDLPGAAEGFMRHWRPTLAVFAESEIWPNLIAAAVANGARLALISARLSDASARRWRRARGAARTLFAAFDLVLPQDEAAAERLRSLGAREAGRLNLKLVAPPLPVDQDMLAATRRAARDRPVLVAASTHPGEDEGVLAAFGMLADRRPAPHLVIVPRHPVRGARIAQLARHAGWITTQQGIGEPFDREQVHVADVMGELGLWFRLSRAAFVGGSWAAEVGGHNPLEPARLDCPVASGPHVTNWAGVYGELRVAQAVREVAGPEALAVFWAEALEGSPVVAEQARRARAVVERGSEALERALDALVALV